MSVLSQISMRGDLGPSLPTQLIPRIEPEPDEGAGELVVADEALEGEVVDDVPWAAPGWASPGKQLFERLLQGLQRL